MQVWPRHQDGGAAQAAGRGDREPEVQACLQEEEPRGQEAGGGGGREVAGGEDADQLRGQQQVRLSLRAGPRPPPRQLSLPRLSGLYLLEEVRSILLNRPSLFTCIVRRLICCGVIFIGEHGEVMLDTRFYKSCSGPRPCPVKTGDPQPSPDTMTDIADSASDYCETYDTENREFYNEETKKGKSNGDEVPTYGQLDPNLETFSTCDS